MSNFVKTAKGTELPVMNLKGKRYLQAGATRFSRKPEDTDDLYQEARMAFVHAIKKFDLSLNLRLSTYARWWILSALQEYTYTNYSTTRLPSNVKFKRVFSYFRQWHKKEGGVVPYPTAAELQEVADKFQVDPSEVLLALRLVLGRDKSFDEPIAPSELKARTFGEGLPDTNPLQDEIIETSDLNFHRHVLLNEALDLLDPRERHIIEHRRLQETPLTLAQLSEVYGVSRERIRQIEDRAFDKMQRFIRRQSTPALNYVH
jgi:RNA polymerase sigma-32 factor